MHLFWSNVAKSRQRCNNSRGGHWSIWTHKRACMNVGSIESWSSCTLCRAWGMTAIRRLRMKLATKGSRPVLGADACVSCTPGICTLYALCAPPWRRGFCTLVLFIYKILFVLLPVSVALGAPQSIPVVAIPEDWHFLKKWLVLRNSLSYERPTHIKRYLNGCSLQKIANHPKLTSSSTCCFSISFN